MAMILMMFLGGIVLGYVTSKKIQVIPQTRVARSFTGARITTISCGF